MKPHYMRRFLDKIGLIKSKFNEYYYHKTLGSMGGNIKIYEGVKILCPENVTIGNNCSINDFVFIHGGGKVDIKDNVTISAYTKIISTGLSTENWEVNSISGPYKKHIDAPIYINTGAWIGSGVTILPGVNIAGKGVIVAAGSVLTMSIYEDNVIYGGVPARKIKDINLKRLD